MKSWKRIVAVVLMAAMAVLMLAACDSSTPTPDPPPPVTGEKTKDPEKLAEWIKLCADELELPIEIDQSLGEGYYTLLDYNKKINAASGNSNLDLCVELTKEKDAAEKKYFEGKVYTIRTITVPKDTGLLEEYEFKRDIREILPNVVQEFAQSGFSPKKVGVMVWTWDYGKYAGKTEVYIVVSDK